jgi:hypothetical protein
LQELGSVAEADGGEAVGMHMLDLTIERLRLNMNDAAGHEHRIGPIAARAAALFADRLEERFGERYSQDSGRMAGISAAPIRLDLNRMNDERAANHVANAWLDALALRLKI